MSFEDNAPARRLVESLENAGVVSITERRDGLAISTRSFVGRLQIGPLDLTIRPKIAWSRWLVLVAFAMRLRDVQRVGRVSPPLDPWSIRDLLIVELLHEARDLLSRGLHREYVRFREALTAPRGRLDVTRLAKRGGLTQSSIPSRYTRRSDNSPLNQALLAGLRFAASRASDRGVRTDAMRLARMLELSVVTRPLSDTLLDAATAELDRRTRRYEPSLRLIRLLKAGETVSIEERGIHQPIAVHGFVLDMNRIWQRVLSRVLGEWSNEIELRDEYSLRGIIRRNPTHPYLHQVPTPRPDFAIFKERKLVGYVDAKYRDLWARPLPRDMLYQLAVYAMAQQAGAAAILYPSVDGEARKQRLDLEEPVSGSFRGAIELRPVVLETLEKLISAPASAARSIARREFVSRLLS